MKALVLAALALAACAKSEAMPPDAGGGAGAPAAGLSCQQIRMCVFGGPCADDACVAACAAKGSPDAQAAFEALRACTARTCMLSGGNYVNCACGEQCQANGSCLHEADVCVNTAPVDDICDSLCA